MGSSRTSGPTRDKLLLILLVVFLVGTLLVLLGVVLDRKEGFPWPEFVVAVGTTLVASSLVGAALERYLKDRFASDMKEELSGMLQQVKIDSEDLDHLRRLPAPLGRAVKEAVLDQPIIERDVTMHYDFSYVPLGRIQVLRAVIRVQGVFENLSEAIVRTDIEEECSTMSNRLRKSTVTRDHGFHRARMEVLDGTCTPTFDMDAASVEPFVTMRDEQCVFSRELTFGPLAIAEVSFEMITYFEESDWDNYTMDRPVNNLTISMSVPPNALELRCTPDEGIRNLWTAQTDPDAGTYRWDVRGGLLPGQGMAIGWEPKEPEG